MKQKNFLTSVTVLLVVFNMNAQVGIGTDNPEPSAILELQSKSKGLLLPRIDDVNNVQNPVDGLLVYNTKENCVSLYKNKEWICLAIKKNYNKPANVVADIEENYLSVNWAKPEVVNNLSKLTMEALIRARNFNGQDAGINTVMGVEGKFLIRIGDRGGYPANQIHIATSGGNFPDADENKGLPTNQWIHIAVTYDSNDGTMIIYVNGKEQSKGIKNVGSVNLGIGGKNGFYIGRSYNDSRWFAGEISECRIWNVVRTPEEIASHPYAVDPDTEGLAAYWKFDEGAGNEVKDHTANGNDAKANKSLKWTKESPS